MDIAAICRLMSNSKGCDDCGDYGKWQPCYEIIPDHIPDDQVKKWLLARRLNV